MKSNDYITKNFQLKEFIKAHDMVDFKRVESNIRYLASDMQTIRDAVASPLIVSSGFRNVNRNREVGGAPNSFHLSGRAVDFYSNVVHLNELHLIVCELMEKGLIRKGGLRKYKTFIHYDHGPIRTW